MDPDEVLRLMRDEIGTDIDDRLRAALALQVWIARLGYRPDNVTDDEIDQTIEYCTRLQATIRSAFALPFPPAAMLP